MDQVFTTETDVSGDRLYAVVADLATYPSWMALVDRVEAEPSTPENQPAWLVTLRGRIGPLARAKRLRMVRTEADGRTVRFERQEVDGRDHASWILTAVVTETSPTRSSVEVSLHYGGSMWTGPLEAVLGRAADDAIAELRSFASKQAAPADIDETS